MRSNRRHPIAVLVPIGDLDQGDAGLPDRILAGVVLIILLGAATYHAIWCDAHQRAAGCPQLESPVSVCDDEEEERP